MSDNHNNSGGLSFNLPEASPSIIKVIGVGGGGGNAVNHMYREGIHDVTYVMCNTDKKALSDSPVPTHLQLGRDGLGAGNRPERGKQAALESLDEIKEMLNDGTRMVFITAGMGGGTGTGAAPIIAQCAKDAGILTVGIVTIPFKFEGMKKINQALDGVDEISKHVDALLVINNERLREIYPDLTVLNAFAKADDTLSIAAARSIAEIITMHGIMNLDFQDVTTVLKDGGVAIMSTGYGEGENRVTKAIEQALNSPLLNNRDIFDSKKVLININFCGDNEQNSLMMEEMNEVNDFMSRFSQDVETKWGLATDSSLGGKVKITLLATGFNLLNVPGIEQVKKEKDIIDEAENDDRLVREGERIARYYDEITQAPRKRLHNIFIFTDDDLDNEDVIAEIDVRPTYKRTRDEVKRIREKEAATTAPSPLEDGGFIINQP
ncbi:MAG: cell division protein FtsZ [Bacteroidaceae bacterium]|nr:cell division protein FtsZ [Bacteroidaceae bacterium]